MMWNPFKKKLSDREKSDFAELIARPLQTQMTLMGNRSIISSANANARAMGYVYGWTDAFLRIRGWDMADKSIGMPILFHALRILWPGDENRIMHYIVEHILDSALQAGMMHGGQQYLDWRNRKLLAPTGLAQCLMASPENPC